MSLGGETLLCPDCGYDLRGVDPAAPGGRCSECGFDLAQLRDHTSNIPWVHRREIGRVKAWCKTVWKFTSAAKWIGLEVARPVSMSEAKSFWLVTSTILSLLPIGFFVAAWHDAGGLTELTQFLPQPSPFLPSSASNRVVLDVLMPWVAGVRVPGLMIVMIWLGTVLACGAPTYLYHPGGLDARSAGRAVALAYYNVATLVPPALTSVILVGVALVAESRSPVMQEFMTLWRLVGGTLMLLTVIGLIVSVMRFVQSLRVTTRCGPVWAIVCVPLPTLFGGVCYLVTLGLVPWVVGFFWLTIDAFRD